MKLSFTKNEHEEFIKNHFQIKTAHVIDEENEMYYIIPVKEDYTKHDRVIAKTQAEKFGFVFGDGLMVLDYKPIKPTCANYERDNVESIIKDEYGQNPLLSEMEQNIADYIAKKDWRLELLEKQTRDIFMMNADTVIDSKAGLFLKKQPCKDAIVESVRQKLLDRSNVGLKKYNSSIFDNIDENYIKHLQEELLDGANYCEQVLRLGEFTKVIIEILQADQNEMSVGNKIIREYNKLKETK